MSHSGEEAEMPKNPYMARRSERGMALIVSLILLVVMTILVISSMRTSILQLRISGSTETLSVNLANAEVSIADFVDANVGRFAPGFLAMPAAAGGALYPATVINDSTVNLVVTQVGCGAANTFTSQMGTNALQAVQFNVAATATVNRGGRSTVHQGTEALAPPGSC
jgi:Tfp pilus assembly protein PilX